MYNQCMYIIIYIYILHKPHIFHSYIHNPLCHWHTLEASTPGRYAWLALRLVEALGISGRWVGEAQLDLWADLIHRSIWI